MLLATAEGEYNFTRYKTVSKRFSLPGSNFGLDKYDIGELVAKSEDSGMKLQIKGGEWRIVQDNKVNFQGEIMYDQSNKAYIFMGDDVIGVVAGFDRWRLTTGETIVLRGIDKGGIRPEGFSPAWPK